MSTNSGTHAAPHALSANIPKPRYLNFSSTKFTAPRGGTWSVAKPDEEPRKLKREQSVQNSVWKPAWVSASAKVGNDSQRSSAVSG